MFTCSLMKFLASKNVSELDDFCMLKVRGIWLFCDADCYRAVSRAVQNLVQPDQLISDAVDVRMELDLRIGK